MKFYVFLHYFFIVPFGVKKFSSWNFNIKSAYYVARELLSKPLPNRGARNPIWHAIWSSNLIPRIKLFLWKIPHNILPHSIALQSRGIEVDIACKVCGGFEDSNMHILLFCVFARSVWSIILPNFDDYLDGLEDNATCFDVLAYAIQNKILEIVGCTMWNLWKNRNRACFDFSSMITHALTALVSNQMDDYRENDVLPHPVVERSDVWRPPDEGDYKINVDASYIAATSTASVAMVARDHQGSIICCATSIFSHVSSVLHGELLAIHFGVTWAISCSMESIIVETDSLLATLELQKGYSSSSKLGAIIIDILNTCAPLSCNFIHVRRAVNGCAHNLAKYAFEFSDYRFWAGVLPSNCCNPDITL